MSISQGTTSLKLDDVLSKVPESRILAHYLGITNVPIVINSPLRKDSNPSFGIYSPDGIRIRFKDFATGDSGSIITLLQEMWHCQFIEVLERIVKDIPTMSSNAKVIQTNTTTNSTTYSGNTRLEIRIRDWEDYDLDYWAKYGISLPILATANVYPISHYFITKDSIRHTFVADKLAYAYIENKEGSTTIKVYQPYNKNNFKWISKHDRSVLGLWTLMPTQGKVVCICSSVKDALCLVANTGIPAICLQGEAYGISETAQKVLKERFEHVCILLDNDEPGIQDAKKLSEQTGFTNIELPQFEGGKDISDYFAILQNPSLFKETIINLFKHSI